MDTGTANFSFLAWRDHFNGGKGWKGSSASLLVHFWVLYSFAAGKGVIWCVVGGVCLFVLKAHYTPISWEMV